MHLTNIITVSPVLFWAPAALLLPVVLAATYQFFSLRVELRLLNRRALSRAEFDARFSEIITELETLRVQCKAAEVRPSPAADWFSSDRAPHAMNLNRRGQILRLHGKGRSTAEIASDLQISQGEVELVLKVQDWSPTASL